MHIRRARHSLDLTRLPVSKIDVFLLTLLEEPLTMDQLCEIAPGLPSLIASRVRQLAALGLVEMSRTPFVRDRGAAVESSLSADDHITVPLPKRAPPSFDEAVTLRPPPSANARAAENPFGEANTPSTGLRRAPRVSSPFMLSRRRSDAC